MKTKDERIAEVLAKFEDEYVHPEHYAVYAAGGEAPPPGMDMRINGAVPKHRENCCGKPLTTEQQLSAQLHMLLQMETYRAAMIKRAIELAVQIKAEHEPGSIKLQEDLGSTE